MKIVPPSVASTAFNCPHCHVLTTQKWFKLYAIDLSSEYPTPTIPVQGGEDLSPTDFENLQELEFAMAWVEKMRSGNPFLSKCGEMRRTPYKADNLHLSRCQECNQLAIWMHQELLYPRSSGGIAPHQDMPESIANDFREASEILAISPRGSAALLRLCVQKLCQHFGLPGKKIDDDIRELVKRGLQVEVQKALDVVRVVGNNAVHPGEMNISDDSATALQLFTLVNFVVQQMISTPKAVQEIYNSLPEGARKAIEKKDGR